MADEANRHWAVGSMTRQAEDVDVSFAREVTAVRFEEIRQEILFVSGLARQRDYLRLLEAVARWERTLEAAAAELDRGPELSEGTHRALALDLAAVSRASDRLENGLLAQTRAHASASSIAAFETVRHRIRAMPPHLLIHEYARAGATVTLSDGVLYFNRSQHGASTIVRTLLGLTYTLVTASLNAIRPKFERSAADLDQLAGDVEEGTPALFSYLLGSDTGGPQQLTMTNLPVAETAAIRQFFVRPEGIEALVQAGTAMSQASAEGILEIGSVDVSTGVIHLNTTSAVNDLPSASIHLDLDLLGSTSVDYWGAVRFAVPRDDETSSVFVGAVREVDLDGSVAKLRCEGAAELTEHNLRGMLAAGVEPGELVRSAIAQAGLPDDVLPLGAALAPPQVEAFEVLVPVRGIRVVQPLRVGMISLVPRESVEGALDRFNHADERAERLATEFDDATSYALAEVNASTLHEAESIGSAAIETAIAWLVTRGRFGGARLPDRRPAAFSREEAVRGPRAASVVLVRGVETGRSWLRWSDGTGDPLERTLDPGSPFSELPAQVSPAMRQALLALSRTTSEGVLESRLQALWEAIEFYAAGTKGPKLFSIEEINRLVDSIPSDLRPEQVHKLEAAIRNLNAPALGVRLRWRLEQDGVRLSDDEHGLLFETLRRARNDLAHGRPIKHPPTREEMHRGVSIVARMLVDRIVATSGDHGGLTQP